MMNNTVGSICLIGARVLEEATIITKLRQAGAIILGKANMSEWAAWRSMLNSTSMGWSPYGGQTVGHTVSTRTRAAAPVAIPINPRQDVVGPMARTVRDSASLCPSSLVVKIRMTVTQ